MDLLQETFAQYLHQGLDMIYYICTWLDTEISVAIVFMRRNGIYETILNKKWEKSSLARKLPNGASNHAVFGGKGLNLKTP